MQTVVTLEFAYCFPFVKFVDTVKIKIISLRGQYELLKTFEFLLNTLSILSALCYATV